MTPAEFDALTHWGQKRLPPPGWDGRTPYLLREGTLHLRGRTVRAYLISDGTRIINYEDWERGQGPEPK